MNTGDIKDDILGTDKGKGRMQFSINSLLRLFIAGMLEIRKPTVSSADFVVFLSS